MRTRTAGETTRILTFGVFVANRERQNERVLLVAVQRQGEGLVRHGHVVPQHVGDGLVITPSSLPHGKQRRGVVAHNERVPQQRTAQVHQLRAHAGKQHQLVQNQVLEAHRVRHVRIHKLGVDLTAAREVLIGGLRQHEARREDDVLAGVGVGEHGGVRGVGVATVKTIIDHYRRRSRRTT